MAYSKAKLKSFGDRASPCFKAFIIGNLSDTFLPTRTLLYVSVRLIFINLTSFLGIPESIIENEILFKICYLDNIVPSSQPLVTFGISCVKFNHQHFWRLNFKISSWRIISRQSDSVWGKRSWYVNTCYCLEELRKREKSLYTTGNSEKA